MTDIVSKATRSRMMSGIKGKDTRPELLIRSQLHCRGYRFRLHRADLPGKPDITLPSKRAVIFVNGCFWHGHACKYFKWPQTRRAFWRKKINGNKQRDSRSVDELNSCNWRVLTIWECALKPRQTSSEAQEEFINKVILWIESGTRNKSLPVRPKR